MSNFLREYLINRKHHAFRKDHPQIQNLGEQFSRQGLNMKERMTRRFELLTALEEPVLLPNEKICFLRTVKEIPDCLTQEEWAELRSKYHIHELGYMSNLSPDYERLIATGLEAAGKDADAYGKRVIDSILNLTDRYCDLAKRQGKLALANVLSRVPRYGATNFYEALQSFRILHFALWLEGNYHNTVGRLDQYMYPYLKADMDKGLYTRETALEMVEDFFLSFNKDSDLYPGVQQGDNGQSLILGGVNKKGEESFNLLSELCLEASRNLLLIDPKINLRVNKNTPVHIYELGTELTRAGLGFPQYSNDDIVIPGLVRLGYKLEDARDYTVAACWEFIIPKVGADVANIGALSFPKVIDHCLHNDLAACKDFQQFLEKVCQQIKVQCDLMCDSIGELWFVPSPFMNVMMTGGIYEGGKYNNFGFHGTGIATATDSLAAIRKYVFDEKVCTAQALIRAVDSDFESNPALLPLLRYEAPKFGNNDAETDALACLLLESFSGSLEGKRNCRGGCFRAGTGSAMYYLWHADEIGASPDGRRKGEPFGTNFSPSLFAKINGPFSVIGSFTKPDFQNFINGGPLTMEFSDSMFRDADSVKKVANLVRTFVQKGGHQMQLNAVNTQRLLDAQQNPEAYRQLVVRIWGWSAYFVELDKAYQDHVLRRQQYAV